MMMAWLNFAIIFPSPEARGAATDSTLAGAEASRKSEQCRIGALVETIQAALMNPEAPDSLSTVTRYGTDSRYYVMIRGWLVAELTGTQSQLSAIRDATVDQRLRNKVEFLKRAIRGIDLE
jgi:hypothetical protein